MSVLKFLFILAIIYLVFRLLWHFVFVLPSALLFTALKFDKGVFLVKGFGYYLLASLFVITVYRFADVGSGVFVLNSLLGLFILFSSLCAGACRAQHEAAQEGNYVVQHHLRYDGLFLLLACGYYLVALFLPALAHNALTEWFFKVARWAFELPVVGFILGAFATLAMLGMIFTGAFAGLALLASLFAGKKDGGEIHDA